MLLIKTNVDVFGFFFVFFFSSAEIVCLLEGFWEDGILLCVYPVAFPPIFWAFLKQENQPQLGVKSWINFYLL